MNNYLEKIAKILRTDEWVVGDLQQKLERATGKTGILKSLAEENDNLLSERLNFLGLNRNSTASEVYDALISKIEADDLSLLNYIGISMGDKMPSIQKTINFVKKIKSPIRGYFLKEAKARELLFSAPPKNILKALGYKYVEEMLEKEDLFEIYSALRFLEDKDWMNAVFFKQYETFQPHDFEERDIELRVLQPKWVGLAEKFAAKKYHNVSHLKELGIIFVIPIFLGISGETLRLISLLLHYFNEIKYYSELFKSAVNDDGTPLFAHKIISFLRGDVIEKRLPEQLAKVERPRFLVIQRYLAKDNENDWRLFEPHINPEAIHWYKAEQTITALSHKLPDFINGLDFWRDLDPIGDFFKSENGKEILISFNLVDMVMALVKYKELIKYLYHQQEALWNEIFIKYFSLEALEEMSKKYILKGWFEV